MEIINEELKIKSFNVDDMSKEHSELLIKQYGCENVDTLAIIYVPGKDTINLNSKHKDFETYKLLVEGYLILDIETRAQFKKNIGNIMSGAVELLDEVIQIREKIKEEINANSVVTLS